MALGNADETAAVVGENIHQYDTAISGIHVLSDLRNDKPEDFGVNNEIAAKLEQDPLLGLGVDGRLALLAYSGVVPEAIKNAASKFEAAWDLSEFEKRAKELEKDGRNLYDVHIDNLTQALHTVFVDFTRMLNKQDVNPIIVDLLNGRDVTKESINFQMLTNKGVQDRLRRELTEGALSTTPSGIIVRNVILAVESDGEDILDMIIHENHSEGRAYDPTLTAKDVERVRHKHRRGVATKIGVFLDTEEVEQALLVASTNPTETIPAATMESTLVLENPNNRLIHEVWGDLTARLEADGNVSDEDVTKAKNYQKAVERIQNEEIARSTKNGQPFLVHTYNLASALNKALLRFQEIRAAREAYTSLWNTIRKAPHRDGYFDNFQLFRDEDLIKEFIEEIKGGYLADTPEGKDLVQFMLGEDFGEKVFLEELIRKLSASPLRHVVNAQDVESTLIALRKDLVAEMKDFVSQDFVVPHLADSHGVASDLEMSLAKRYYSTGVLDLANQVTDTVRRAIAEKRNSTRADVRRPFSRKWAATGVLGLGALAVTWAMLAGDKNDSAEQSEDERVVATDKLEVKSERKAVEDSTLTVSSTKSDKGTDEGEALPKDDGFSPIADEQLDYPEVKDAVSVNVHDAPTDNIKEADEVDADHDFGTEGLLFEDRNGVPVELEMLKVKPGQSPFKIMLAQKVKKRIEYNRLARTATDPETRTKYKDLARQWGKLSLSDIHGLAVDFVIANNAGRALTTTGYFDGANNLHPGMQVYIPVPQFEFDAFEEDSMTDDEPENANSVSSDIATQIMDGLEADLEDTDGATGKSSGQGLGKVAGEVKSAIGVVDELAQFEAGWDEMFEPVEEPKVKAKRVNGRVVEPLVNKVRPYQSPNTLANDAKTRLSFYYSKLANQDPANAAVYKKISKYYLSASHKVLGKDIADTYERGKNYGYGPLNRGEEIHMPVPDEVSALHNQLVNPTDENMQAMWEAARLKAWQADHYRDR